MSDPDDRVDLGQRVVGEGELTHLGGVIAEVVPRDEDHPASGLRFSRLVYISPIIEH